MTRSVIYLLGGIHFFAGLSMTLPAAVGLWSHEPQGWVYLGFAVFTLLIAAIPLRFVKRDSIKVTPKVGIAAVSLGWFCVPLFAALPMLATGEVGSFTDCYFESVSGFTTTGASVLANVDSLSRATHFWRTYIQWMGGMGIVLVTVAVFSFLGEGGIRLYNAEVPGLKDDKLLPRVATVARTLWLTYIVISAVQVLLLRLGGMSWFDAVCHTFATMATGGYSTKTASLAYWDSSYLQWVVTAFMAVAGANFALHATVFRHKGLGYLRDPETRFYLGTMVLATGLISVARASTGPVGSWDTFLRHNAFSVVSVMTTTGFANCDYEQWQNTTQLPAIVLVALMFVGGAGGSTGGGFKCIRLLLLFKLLGAEIKRVIHPRAIVSVKLAGQTVPDHACRLVAVLFFAWAAVFLVASLSLAMLGIDAVTALTAVAATLNNVGPGLGTVGPSENYGYLPSTAKWILSVCMVGGRLELLSVLPLLAPGFWRR